MVERSSLFFAALSLASKGAFLGIGYLSNSQKVTINRLRQMTQAIYGIILKFRDLGVIGDRRIEVAEREKNAGRALHRDRPAANIYVINQKVL